MERNSKEKNVQLANDESIHLHSLPVEYRLMVVNVLHFDLQSGGSGLRWIAQIVDVDNQCVFRSRFSVQPRLIHQFIY